MSIFKDKVILITGATRGIGRSFALKFAADQAIVAITGKTVEPHSTLPGTLSSVADEVKDRGGIALAYPLDVRDDMAIKRIIDDIGKNHGKIDILINNAGAIYLADTLKTPMRKFDLMQAVNVRACFACSQAAIPYLEKSENPHIINICPPLNFAPENLAPHLAYTLSKYGMSLCTMGMAEELRSKNIAVNALWPQTTIATMAVKVHFSPEIFKASRHPEIMADAAYLLAQEKNCEKTAQFYTDESFLREKGYTDFSPYAVDPTSPLYPDLFLNEGSANVKLTTH